ncbi:MAG: endonuclease/exonuclease/phosphatase family protein [Propionibacteriaceae bacterium]
MTRSRHLAVLTAAVIGLGLTPTALHATLDTPTLAPSSAQAASTTTVRVATFNVRTARATQDKQSWLQRAPRVAREILARNPGVVALQELGPGRADGRAGTLGGTQRQTDNLTANLARLGGGRYKLVRTTSYVVPGAVHSTQGARILYDTSRYVLRSNCVEVTAGRPYSPTCAIELPVAAGDSAKLQRSAAYASFQERRTGRMFFVVSAHLDSRHSKNNKTEAKYNALRARQAATIVDRVARVNTRRLPVIFGGDINAWQTDRGKYAPHRALVARGYRDSTAAKLRYNIAFPTINHFKTTVKKSKSKKGGVRLDVLLVKGGHGVKRYENKLLAVNRARPSDHNMVLADFVV